MTQHNTTPPMPPKRTNSLPLRTTNKRGSAETIWASIGHGTPRLASRITTPMERVHEFYKRMRSTKASVKIPIAMTTMKSLNPLVTETTMMIAAIPLNPRLPWPICEICWSSSGNSSRYSSRTRKWRHHHEAQDQKTSSRSHTQNATVEVRAKWRPSSAPFVQTSELSTTSSEEGIRTKFSTCSITSEAGSITRIIPNERRACLTLSPGDTTYSPMTTHAYITTTFWLPKSRSSPETKIGSRTHPPEHTTK